MTVKHNWVITQGAQISVLLPYVGLPQSGYGVRIHVRDAVEADAARLIIVHTGPASQNAVVTPDGVLITIGATVSSALDMSAGAADWPYDCEVYSLTDADAVIRSHKGFAHTSPEATRGAGGDTLPLIPTGGATGAAGPAGAAGATGPTGPAGADGAVGAAGATGATGPAGADGAAGAAGTNGATGPTGATGPAGADGVAGVAGAAGATGATGPTGPAGADGAAGAAGTNGATGPTGATGPAGADGAAGAAGATGATGATGAGGNPGGSATELQFRAGASTLGGADGTAWDAVNKRVSFGAGASPVAVMHLKSDSASEVVLTIDGTTSQTANLMDWRNSSGTILASVTSAGKLLLPDGTAALPGYSFVADTDTGIVRLGANSLGISVNGVTRLQIDGGTTTFTNNLESTNGTSQLTAFKRAIQLRTATGGISTGYNLYIFNNTGAGARVDETLPSAAAGYQLSFYTGSASGWRLTAASGDTIRIRDKVTAAAGYIESTTLGSIITLIAVDATQWIAFEIGGQWTDGTFTYDDTSLTTP